MLIYCGIVDKIKQKKKGSVIVGSVKENVFNILFENFYL
jgi:hypothetical protein